MAEAYVYDAVRTPRGKGKKDGSLHEVPAVRLAAKTLEALRDRNGLDTGNVDDIIFGCVDPVGEAGSVIPRAAAFEAGYDTKAPGMQISRFCASGLDAINFGAAKIAQGADEIVIAGGVESMSRVGMGASGGAWFMDPSVGLPGWFVPQGISADLIATKYGFSRDDVDAYAVESQKRAAKSWADGRFKNSVVPIKDQNGLTILDHDEHMRPSTDMQSLASLNPSFVMPANIGSEPVLMLTGPVDVTEKLLKRAKMKLSDIDLFELNEAFASVVLRYMQAFDIDHDKINVNGGAIAMGHPLGATGAMIFGTVLDELERRDLNTALVTLCIGAGMGTATIIERV
ncbi:acetyl-CoA acetyltransferase [Mesorhizobium sp. L2C084A000]|uniref:acetyl-CoA acetyltransferase n=1 Tax=Mesorhizobium sp. L2C084A000 TaxID=1287116 RepID=UPI0003CFC4A0|nr:acetyl-CoA acetyltransferase [Mesorhizobium sp. L2C084A000]ESZ26334.1 3-ketoacyl-CoA thiolase [Mesorhizobium sp. L2C084A000]